MELANARDLAIAGTVMCGGSFCGGKNPAKALHICPYKEAINDDSVHLCNCCDECRQECVWEI